MKIFGLPIPFTNKEVSPVPTRGGWWTLLKEGYTGSWQQGVEVNTDTVSSFHANFSCQSLIASDISKLRVKLVGFTSDGIWIETTNPAYSPVIRKPNAYQNRIQFFENWVLSKLQRGNTYILKERDNRNVVVRLHVLDPTLVTVLVSDNGEVFYDLNMDKLAKIPQRVTVPASEIIHDRFNCLFHPLVGISPIYANGLSATHGLSIQNNSTLFFQNHSQPGGILSAPNIIKDETAQRIKEYWEQNYSGNNIGKVAVLGDGLKYESMSVDAKDAQLIEQLKWTAEIVCSTYHVPPYKIGIGALPSYNNVQALNVEYYSQCLQTLIESIELCLDEGLGIGEAEKIGTEFDIEGLLRMDSVTQMQVLDAGRNLLKVNESRKRLDLPPVFGGDTVYRQQQDYSIEALAKRDASPDPFGTAQPPVDNKPENTPADRIIDSQSASIALYEKHLREAINV